MRYFTSRAKAVELAERVRTAESSAETYASQRAEVEERALERVREAEERTSVAEEARARAESDFQALRGSIASLKAMWAREVRGYRDEMDRRDDELRRERAEWEAKRTELLALVNSQACVQWPTPLTAELSIRMCWQ